MSLAKGGRRRPSQRVGGCRAGITGGLDRRDILMAIYNIFVCTWCQRAPERANPGANPVLQETAEESLCLLRDDLLSFKVLRLVKSTIPDGVAFGWTQKETTGRGDVGS